MNNRGSSILINTSYGHFLSHFNMLVFPAVVLPLSARLNLPLAQTLQLSLWMYLLLGLTALPWGLAADRWGADILMRAFYLGSGLCGLAAAWWINSPTALVYSLAGIGFFSGIYHPIGLGMISKSSESVSVGMGIVGMFGNLGMAAAPLLAGVFTWVWGPRAVYIMLGIMNLAGLFLARSSDSSQPVRQDTQLHKEGGSWLVILCVLLVSAMLGGVVYRGATVITPAYFELKLQTLYRLLSDLAGGGASRNLVATSITSSIFLVGMAGQYLGGRIADIFDQRYCYLVFNAVTIPCAVLIAVFSESTLVFFVFVYFFFLLGMQPVENALFAHATPQRFHHTAFGAKFIVTFGVGAFAVRMLAVVEERFGIGYSFPALAFFSALMVLAVAVLIAMTRDRAQPALDHSEAD